MDGHTVISTIVPRPTRLRRREPTQNAVMRVTPGWHRRITSIPLILSDERFGNEFRRRRYLSRRQAAFGRGIRPTRRTRTLTESLIKVRGWVADRRLCG